MPTINDYLNANVWKYRVSQDTKFNPSFYVSIIQSFIEFFGHFVLEISASEDGVFWSVTDVSLSGVQPPAIGKNMQIERIKLGNLIDWEPPVHQVVYKLYSLHTYSIPYLYINDISTRSDPLETLINSMSNLRDQEEIHYYIHVRRANKPDLFSGESLLDFFGRSVHRDTWAGQNVTSKAQRIMQHKGNQKLYECQIFVQANAKTAKQADVLARNVVGTFRGFARMRAGEPKSEFGNVRCQNVDFSDPDHIIHNTPLFWYIYDLKELAKKHGRNAFKKIYEKQWEYLSVEELATMWHLPHSGFDNTNVAWLKALPEVPSAVVQNDEGIVLGEGIRGREAIPVKLPTRNRTTHMNVVGQTGSGKSTFLHNLIHQDIADGKGVCVIDPHGTLVKDILRYSIPLEREQDVVLLDFGQSDYPVPFNLFSLSQNSTTLGYVSDIIEAITARHYGNTTGIQTSVFLKNALQVLGYTNAPTMRSVQKFLTDGSYRFKTLENLPPEADYLYDWWFDHYHERSDKDQFQISTPILTRIDTFIKNRHTYPSLCHPDVINIREFVEKKRIVLVSLKATSDQMSEKDRDLIGALFIMMLQMFGMEENEQVNMPKFYVYVDEVQHFTTTALDRLFTEARKFGLSMTVANQYLGQLDTSTMDAIMNNVGATVAFGIGTKDATMLTPFMSPYFDRDSLVQMNAHEAAVRMKVGTATQSAFWLKTYPPVNMSEEFIEDEVQRREFYLRGISAQNHTPKSRQDVELWLRKQYPRRGSDNIDLEDNQVEPPEELDEDETKNTANGSQSDNTSDNSSDDDDFLANFQEPS